MKKLCLCPPVVAATMAAVALTGCIDDKYDLSDVDTTVRVTVDDLQVPVRLDAITLSSIFDINDGSVIKEIDDTYAVLVDGKFHSDGTTINKVHFGMPEIESIVTTIPSGDISNLPAGFNAAFPISDISTDFEFNTSSVDKSIKSLSKISTQWNIRLTLSFSNYQDVVSNMKVHELRIQMPNGLNSPDFTSDNGVINLGDRDLVDGKLEVDVLVTSINFAALDPQEFSFTPDPDGENPGTLFYKGSIGIKSGIVTGTVDACSQAPSHITMTFDPRPGEIIVDSYSGSIQYAIGKFDVSSVDLNDLPDVLTQEGTNIKIANPQLYLAINNPLANYGVNGHSGMMLTAVRGENRTPYPLPAGSEITIGHDKGIVGPYNICLSPTRPDTYYTGFEGASHVSYPALSDVLSGDGLPASVDVNFDNACIGPDIVDDFTLGVTLADVDGNYTFYAPLAFNAGSKVIYNGDETGWGGDDDTFDKIFVEKLTVNARVENSLPFDIILTGYPLDRQGNQCKDPQTGRPVSLGSIEVKAGHAAEISLATDGTVTGLDGIHYEAKASVTDETSYVLRPSATIELTNIRAKVSGYYDDEL